MKPEEVEKLSSAFIKTSSANSKSEGSLSTSKEQVPFSKFKRALDLAQSKKDLKLTESIIISTLKQLENIAWRWTGNTISATNNHNSLIHITLHTHDDSGTLWYKKPENVSDFLRFVGECNSDLNDRILKIGKK